MKVLAIGNSFSQDATRYLKKIADADNEPFKVVNLYIGGCPLSAHYMNALENSRVYSLEFNGEATGFSTTIKEALMTELWGGGWDVVTIQQVSHMSPNYDTYQPFLNFMADYIRKYSPKAKIYIHQTWAYEDGSNRLTNELGYNNHKEMLADIVSAYNNAKNDIKADGIIRSGEMMSKLLDAGIPKVHRDTFHASLGLGRYALGLLWYKTLTGKSISNNTFAGFDEEISAEDIKTVKSVVENM